MGTALAFATTILAQLPALLQAGQDVMDLLGLSNRVLTRAQAEGNDPTPAEWDELNALIAEKRQQLHAP